ncbi:MAG: 4-(cytidine 5'-diphospho)-2-C-methyl-D-erythritol kinase [Bacteroidetes bacterium]|nr:4-(cytidine 5'-diphospho)-2-C-methyl-D-erythritol kinase [Bacteroidota bacterium]
MICFPNAKINIGLTITGKRADGFHNIESVMYPLKGIVYDALEIVESLKFKVQCSGIMIPGNENENLCVKTYNLIKKDYPQLPPIKIYLNKVIPIGAGLGGGSADAAFFIRLLNDTFELGLAWGEIHHYAKQLGSDCSFFISNKPVFAKGKGDELESLNLSLSKYHIALVCPNIHINTAQAYSMVKLRPDPKGGNAQSPFRSDDSEDDEYRTPSEDLGQIVIKLPIEDWKNKISNDFENVIFPQYPEIKKIKEKLYALGAVYASMSGSGSSVYGIFKKEPKVKEKFVKYQVWEGSFT